MFDRSESLFLFRELGFLLPDIRSLLLDSIGLFLTSCLSGADLVEENIHPSPVILESLLLDVDPVPFLGDLFLLLFNSRTRGRLTGSGLKIRFHRFELLQFTAQFLPSCLHHLLHFIKALYFIFEIGIILYRGFE